MSNRLVASKENPSPEPSPRFDHEKAKKVFYKSFSQSKKHKKEGLNDEEIDQLAYALKELPNTAQNTRIKAIISLLVLQGLRQVEITRLNVKDIDLIRKTALVEGKGKDDKECLCYSKTAPLY